jgi:hypothetical protein
MEQNENPAENAPETAPEASENNSPRSSNMRSRWKRKTKGPGGVTGEKSNLGEVDPSTLSMETDPMEAAVKAAPQEATPREPRRESRPRQEGGRSERADRSERPDRPTRSRPRRDDNPVEEPKRFEDEVRPSDSSMASDAPRHSDSSRSAHTPRQPGASRTSRDGDKGYAASKPKAPVHRTKAPSASTGDRDHKPKVTPATYKPCSLPNDTFWQRIKDFFSDLFGKTAEPMAPSKPKSQRSNEFYRPPSRNGNRPPKPFSDREGPSRKR